MSIRFECGDCGKKLKVSEQHAGKKTKCPGCGKAVVIPAVSEPRDPTVDLAPEEQKQAAPAKPSKTAKPEKGAKPAEPEGKSKKKEKPEKETKSKEKPGAEAAGGAAKKKSKLLLIVIGLVVVLGAAAAYFWFVEGYIPFIIPKP